MYISHFCSLQAFGCCRVGSPELAPSRPHLTFITSSAQQGSELQFLYSQSGEHQAASAGGVGLGGAGRDWDEQTQAEALPTPQRLFPFPG